MIDSPPPPPPLPATVEAGASDEVTGRPGPLIALTVMACLHVLLNVAILCFGAKNDNMGALFGGLVTTGFYIAIVVGLIKKHFDKINGNLVIDGAFTEIDEGNFALHFMLALLGKARIVCRVQVSNDGNAIVDEVVRMSATCSCFTPGTSFRNSMTSFKAHVSEKSSP